MLDFFASFFNVYWSVFILALVPTVESKVAIPFGISQEIWSGEALSPIVSGLIAFLGSMLPCIFVIILCKFIKKRSCGFVVEKFATKFQNKYRSKFVKLDSKRSALKKCLLLASFVAIPLPLTGVYTGSMIAGLSSLNVWQGFLSVFVGEVVSCLIVVLLCTVFENSTFYIFMISLVVCAVYVLLSCVITLISKLRNKKRKEM